MDVHLLWQQCCIIRVGTVWNHSGIAVAVLYNSCRHSVESL